MATVSSFQLPSRSLNPGVLLRIGIDLMGSDSSPYALFDAVIEAAQLLDATHRLEVIAIKGVTDQLSTSPQITALSNHHHAAISFHQASDFIAMDEDPGSVLNKKDSSLAVGIELLKNGNLDAFVSCGNTGALITSATLSIPKLPGIKRPALLVCLPTEKGMISTIDVGSTVEAKSEFLVQFASLGAAFQRIVNGCNIPKVGLLNIGVESTKGTAEVRKAYNYLMEQEAQEQESLPRRMQFIGNVEARDVFKGVADVIVTDGFTGNILLKASEGVSSFIFSALESGLMGDDAPASFRRAFSDLHKRFNYSQYPGAVVCGIDGIVIKVHGDGSPKALFSSIMGAASYVRLDLPARLKSALS